MPQSRDQDEQLGLVIPILVLGIVMLITRVGWLVIPLAVLICVLFGNVREETQIRKREEKIDYWRTSEPGTYTSGYVSDPIEADRKPIYDLKKQKQQGTDFGLVLPILIIAAVWLFTGVVWMTIPLFVLLLVCVFSYSGRSRTSSRVRTQLYQDDVESVQDIADRTGVPEDEVRQYIVDQKRSGESGIWFDSSTGTKISSPVKEPLSEKTGHGCLYCGFALRNADRFCPFCGAPIRAGT
ncbi:MAG: zinc ribbon domain-containing protein [Candidatus Thorarchaeota archaeon]|nr:zinc ribbon domain-containing protein [Candidatus Thorarchaeota archaeon]